jgi:protein phosphatase
MGSSGFWEDFATDWACLDCELMPWSVKAQELLRSQYAAVGAAGRASLPKALDALKQAADRSSDIATCEGENLLDGESIGNIFRRYQDRHESLEKFIDAYRQYCWSVESIDDLKLAPFHLMATEGKVYVGQNHRWQMDTLAKICRYDSTLLMATPYRAVDVTDPQSESEGIHWWLELTERGGEGMVVKPLDFITKAKRGLTQPALKCRGREYLRIIYGPDYTTEENLSRLRNRGLATKRSLALREFALGIEALERFVRREPLRRVHECVFGVLALESEPVDPRL